MVENIQPDTPRRLISFSLLHELWHFDFWRFAPLMVGPRRQFIPVRFIILASSVFEFEYVAFYI
jgi:hypothetical protein